MHVSEDQRGDSEDRDLRFAMTQGLNPDGDGMSSSCEISNMKSHFEPSSRRNVQTTSPVVSV